MLDTLLPDAVLDHLAGWLPAVDRCRLAATCATCRRVHLASDWRRLRCSMHGLLGPRDAPEHWTADLDALLRLLARPMFARLERLHVDLDAPCFASGAPRSARLRARPPLSLSLLERLDVRALRRYAAPGRRPCALALRGLLRVLPGVRCVTLSGLCGLSHALLTQLLRADAPLRRLVLDRCLLTDRARLAMTSLLVDGIDEAHDASSSSPSWPSLEALEFTGGSAPVVVARAARLLGDRPLQLPYSLRHLDLSDAVHRLKEVQLLLTLAFLPRLSEVVVQARSHGVLDTLDRFRPGLFRQLTVRILV